MTVAEKLRILADGAKYDASCASSGAVRKGTPAGIGNSDATGICHSYTPDGRCVSLLKILLTNYLHLRLPGPASIASSSDVARARFAVQEVVDLTLEFYRRNYIEGLFLSSGIIQSPDYTTEQLVEVARRLRLDHAFGGYIHLKLIPGRFTRAGQAAAGLYADRVSANIELADASAISTAWRQRRPTSRSKRTMAVVTGAVEESGDDRRTIREAPAFAPAGQTTQMIVGSDRQQRCRDPGYGIASLRSARPAPCLLHRHSVRSRTRTGVAGTASLTDGCGNIASIRRTG